MGCYVFCLGIRDQTRERDRDKSSSSYRFTWLSLYNVRTRGQDDGEIERMNCVAREYRGRERIFNDERARANVFIRVAPIIAREILTRLFIQTTMVALQRDKRKKKNRRRPQKRKKKKGSKKERSNNNCVHLSRIICGRRR